MGHAKLNFFTIVILGLALTGAATGLAGRAATLAVGDLPALTTGFLHRQEVLPPAVALLLDEVSSSLRSF